MDIYFDRSHYCKNIVVKDTNVHIEEDVEKRTFFKDEEGNSKIVRDISDDSLNMVSSTLDHMIYDRVADYDSSGLIESLLEKLPQEKREELYKHIREEYINED